jgi:hypothetical protein
MQEGRTNRPVACTASGLPCPDTETVKVGYRVCATITGSLHRDLRRKRGRLAGTCGSCGAHSYQPRRRYDDCGCLLCIDRDHDASYQDTFVYRAQPVAHNRAMDVSTTAMCLDSRRADDEN